MRALVWFLWGILFFIPPSHAAQATFGDCSPILNNNFADPSAVERFFGSATPDLEHRVILIQQVIDCTGFIDDKTKLRETLVFSLRQMLLLKKKYVLPALNDFIDNPTQGRAKLVENFVLITNLSIEDSIKKATALDAQLGGTTVSDPSQALTNTQETLRNTFQLLGEKMGIRLGINSELENKAWIEDGLRMKELRDRYAKLLDQLTSLTDNLASHSM
jgi:hypothetical protein